MKLNADLELFANFASTEGSADEAARVRYDARQNKEIVASDTTASWFQRTRKTSEAAIEACRLNNDVRDTLIAALKEQFDVDSFAALPDRVKKALKGTYATTPEGDFVFNGEGKATSGCPLTRRRISQVIEAAREVAIQLQKQQIERPAPVADAMIAERKQDANVEALATAIVSALAEKLEDKSVINERYNGIAMAEVKRFIKRKFCDLGKEEGPGFAGLVKDFRRMCLDRCGILPVYHLEGVSLEDWRTKRIESAFRRAISAYNAEYPDSAYQV